MDASVEMSELYYFLSKMYRLHSYTVKPLLPGHPKLRTPLSTKCPLE